MRAERRLRASTRKDAVAVRRQAEFYRHSKECSAGTIQLNHEGIRTNPNGKQVDPF